MTELANPARAAGQPEEALGAKHTTPRTAEEIGKTLRIEGPPGAIDKARDTVFLGLRDVLLEALELFLPKRGQRGLLLVVPPHVHDLGKVELAEIGLIDCRIGIEPMDDRIGIFALLERC